MKDKIQVSSLRPNKDQDDDALLCDLLQKTPSSKEETDQAVEILLSVIDKQWAQARQSEDQRATTTNFIITLAVALQSFIVQRNFDFASVALGIVIMLLGIYGLMISAKYYERFRISTNRIGDLMRRLEEINKMAQIYQIQKKADKEHRDRFPRLHKIRLHRLWYALHIGVTFVGIINTAIIIILHT